MPRSNASNKAKGSQPWKEMMLFRGRAPRRVQEKISQEDDANPPTPR